MSGLEDIIMAHWSRSTHSDSEPMVDKCDGCGAVIYTWGTDADVLECLAAHQAAELAKAGYGKPRTVTTVEELDAAIIRRFEEGEPLTLRAKDGRPFILWEDEYGTMQVTSYPQEGDVNPLSITDITLPAVTP